MKEESPINPYAAPKAQLVNPKTRGGGAPHRPRAVKWATFFLGFAFFANGWVYWNAISIDGFQKVWQAQSILDPILLLPIGLGFSLFGGRSKTAYYVNAGVLALMIIKIIGYHFFVKWASKDSFAGVLILDRCFEALMCGLLGFLFYRFTFGLPSRRYFGFVPVK